MILINVLMQHKVANYLTADELALGRDAVNLCIMVDDDQGIRVADTKATTKIVASHNPFVAADRLSDS